MFPFSAKRKRGLTKCQLNIVSKCFQTSPYLEDGESVHLSRFLNVSKSKIEGWFSNKRRQMKGQLFTFKGE